jgi:hypothetical protein
MFEIKVDRSFKFILSIVNLICLQSSQIPLAPRDRNQAMNFLSPAWERVELRDNEVSFWSSVKDAEIYAFKTLNKNKESVEIRVWLKYNMKNSYYPKCETRTFEVVLYELEGEKQWLLEDTYNLTTLVKCEI